MAINVFSTPYDIRNESILKHNLQHQGFIFTNVAHAFWRAQRDKITITFYQSGKILIQGWGADQIAHEILSDMDHIPILEEFPGIQSWIGTDEAGKGDFWGPLVVAAVFSTKTELKKLMLAEVQDSKNLTDKKISIVARQLKKHFQHEIVLIAPEKYNQLYAQSCNLNSLLASVHAEAIDLLLQRVQCDLVLSDKFANESLLVNALLKKGRRIKLVQKTNAEENPAVAAAAILARNSYLEYLIQLSATYGMEFSKGSAEKAIATGRLFKQRFGSDQLSKVAKLHFKTINNI